MAVKTIEQLTALVGSSVADGDIFEVEIDSGSGFVTRKVTGLGLLYSQRQRVVIPISSLTDDATVATSDNKIRDINYGMKVLSVGAFCTVAPTGSTASIQIQAGGADILSTAITIDSGEKTSATAVTPPVISTSLIAADTELTFDIDQVGSSTAGKGYYVYIEYKLRKV